MNRIKNNLKEFFCDKKLYLYSIITVLFFGIYAMIQYAPDTYFVFSVDSTETMTHFFSCGRFVTGIFFKILLGIFKLKDITIYNISYLIAIICTILSMYKLDKLFEDITKNKKLIVISTIFIIINIFSIELYMYIEKGILMLSVLLCILAIEQTKKFFEGNKKSIFFAIFIMILANCCYQGTVGLYVGIALLYIIKYSKNCKEFIKNNILVALIYGIPAIINFILVRFIFINTRVKGEIILEESIKKMIKGIKDMIFGTYQLFPKYLFAIMLSILIIFIVYKVIKKQEQTKTKILKVLGIGYIIAGTVFATVIPQIMQDTESIWFVARSTYSGASLIGILMLYALENIEIKKVQLNAIMIISCIILSIQFIYFTKFTVDDYIVNYQDRQEVKQIEKIMHEYEKNTGETITKIAVYEDKNPNYTYFNISSSGDMNLKSIYKDWSTVSVLNYYMNRNLENTKLDNEIQEEFKQHEWDYFNEGQVIFKGDTLHICVY